MPVNNAIKPPLRTKVAPLAFRTAMRTAMLPGIGSMFAALE